MACNPLVGEDGKINGFVCSNVGGYMEAEFSWWQKNIELYKKTFISYMVDSGRCDEKSAISEVEAHIENVGIDGIETPEGDAEECMSYWDGE